VNLPSSVERTRDEALAENDLGADRLDSRAGRLGDRRRSHSHGGREELRNPVSESLQRRLRRRDSHRRWVADLPVVHGIRRAVDRLADDSTEAVNGYRTRAILLGVVFVLAVVVLFNR